MKSNLTQSPGESSGKSIRIAEQTLLPASPLQLETVRALALDALEESDIKAVKNLLREQIAFLNDLIEQATAEDEIIYQWASSQ